MRQAESTKKLLVFWPRFEAGIDALFRTLLDNFDTTIVFVAAGSKAMSASGDIDEKGRICSADAELGDLNRYYEEGSIVFLNFPAFRIAELGPLDMVRMYSRIKGLISGNDWNLVMCSTQTPLHSKIAAHVCRKKKVPYGVKVESWEEYPARNPLMKLYKTVDKRVIRNAAIAYPHGNAASGYCASVAPATPIAVMPLLIEDCLQAKYSESLNRFVYCGALNRIKNGVAAVKAFLSSTQLREHAKFIVAGDGPMRTEIESMVASSGAESAVEFIGPYDRERLPDILDEHSVFVLPSLNDGWSLAALEATALGRPLILSDRVGARLDLLEDDRNGYTVQPEDIHGIATAMEAINRLDADRAMGMQWKSRELYEQHNRKEQVIDAINQAIECGSAHLG